MKNIFFTTALFLSVPMLTAVAQNKTANVTIDYRTQKFLGETSRLQRDKYFNMHISYSELTTDPDIKAFDNDYDIGAGRQFWGPFSQAYNWNGNKNNGTYPYNKVSDKGGVRPVQRYIATEHANSQILTLEQDTEEMGKWAAAYYKAQDYVPEFFEPMNEPFVHADDGSFGDVPDSQTMIDQIIEYHAACGKYIRQEPDLVNMKVIGYAAAWPSFEINNFSHWNMQMKRFIDRAGQYMDGISVHLYDGTNVVGPPSLRSGSNSEAILDIIETYSHIALGKTLPFAISEYGGIAQDEDGYDPIISSRTIATFNHILFNLLDREDNLLISIPFSCGKSTWNMTEANGFTPYGPATFVPASPITQSDIDNNFANVTWKRTPKENFYKLWKGVQGDRVDITSDNPDIQVQAFKDGSSLYIAMDNLDTETHTVYLKNDYNWDGIKGNVSIRHLKIFNDQDVDYGEQSSAIPESIEIRPDETIVIVANVNSSYTNQIVRKKYYSDTYLRPIISNGNITFNFTGVESGVGRAVARMTLGRTPEASKRPIVKINNTEVTMPVNWEGEEQADRDDFFGMIEIPFDLQLLKNGENTITVTFPDAGGFVASMILQTEKYAITDVVNGDFKNNLTNWVPLNYSGNLLIDATEKGDEDNSLNIVGKAGVFQSVSTEEGRSYELVADYKTKDDSKLLVLIKDTDGNEISKQEFQSSRRFDDLSIKFVATGHEVICAFMSQNADGCVWVDNVKLSIK